MNVFLLNGDVMDKINLDEMLSVAEAMEAFSDLDEAEGGNPLVIETERRAVELLRHAERLLFRVHKSEPGPNHSYDNDLAMAMQSAHNSDNAEPVAQWHIGAQNDGLFIIDTPPRPSNDDQWHDRPDGPSVAIPVWQLPEGIIQMIVDAHNDALASPPAKEVDLFEMVRVAYFRGYQWCVENPDSPEYVAKAAYDYADKTTSALTNRTPDDEVGNGMV